IVSHLRDAIGEERPGPQDRMTGRDARLRQAEPLQRAQRVARLDDPDAVDRPLRIALDDVDLDALASQCERRAQSANPAPHHEHPHIVTSPPPATSAATGRSFTIPNIASN